jgi:hypothetical protein
MGLYLSHTHTRTHVWLSVFYVHTHTHAWAVRDSVVMAEGYLELPQLRGAPSRAALQPERCVLVDAHVAVYIWVGRQAPPELRVAARKLALVCALLQAHRDRGREAVRESDRYTQSSGQIHGRPWSEPC